MTRIARHRSLLFWALAGVALLVSHDVVYLVQVGPGAELARVLRGAGHEYWGLGSALLGGIGFIAAVATLVRLRHLRRTARELHARSTRSYPRRVLRTWALLLAVVAVGFVIQESAEHLVAHGHAIGVGALLSAEYPLALPVIATITGLAALIVALAADVELRLLAAIASALARPRPGRAVPRPAAPVPGRSSIRSRPGASRAPPVLFAT